MAYRFVPSPMTLGDLEGRSPVAGLIKCNSMTKEFNCRTETKGWSSGLLKDHQRQRPVQKEILRIVYFDNFFGPLTLQTGDLLDSELPPHQLQLTCCCFGISSIIPSVIKKVEVSDYYYSKLVQTRIKNM